MTAPAAMPTVEIDGFSFQFRYPGGPSIKDDDGHEWTCLNLEGWGNGPPVRTQRSARSGGHGSYRSPSYRGERTIALTGLVSAASAADLEGLRRRVSAMCSDGENLYELAVVDPTNGTLTADVELADEIVPTWVSDQTFTFLAQFVAPDPRRYGEWKNSDAILNPGLTGGADMTAPGANMSTPGLDMGTASEGGTTTVITSGTAPVGPVVAFTGPANQPRTVCNELGMSVQYLQTLSAGQVLYVNLGDFEVQPPGALFPVPPRAAVIDGQYQDPNVLITGGFPELRPGVTTWQFTAASYDASAAMRIWTRDGWW